MAGGAALKPRISRVLRSKQDAQAAYDRLAKWYDVFSSGERAFMLSGIDLLEPKPGERILEIGYGTGHALVQIARAVGPAGRVCGIDISLGMASQALRRVDRAALSTRVRLACADAAALPYDSGSFDGVFCCFTLELFDTADIPAVLIEWRRVARSEGRICIVAMATEKPAGGALRAYEWLHARFPNYVDCRPIPLLSFLGEVDLSIIATGRRRMWGLPVEIALARKNPLPGEQAH